MSARTSKLQPPADGGDKSHTRWIVSLTAAAALLYRRDILMLRLLVGAIGSAVVCKILKRLINKARPASSSLSDPGMPSSHAQALFFFSTYLSWMARESTHPHTHAHTLALRHTLTQCRSTELAPPNTTLVPSALSLAALLLTARRVQRGHHDVAQVLVGGLLGIVNSTLWYHYSYLILTASDSGTYLAHRSTASSLVLIITRSS